MLNYWKRNNIIIRAFEERDIENFVKNNTMADSLQQWYYDFITFPKSSGDVLKTLEAMLGDSKEDRRILVIENDNGEYVGEVFIWYADKRNGVFRYGISIYEQFRGRGYAKNALIIILDYYFNELNYVKCSPTVYEYNKNSQLFHEKLGFVLEGRLRDEIFTRGKRFDLFYYGMTRGEFNEKYSHFETK